MYEIEIDLDYVKARAEWSATADADPNEVPLVLLDGHRPRGDSHAPKKKIRKGSSRESVVPTIFLGF